MSFNFVVLTECFPRTRVGLTFFIHFSLGDPFLISLQHFSFNVSLIFCRIDNKEYSAFGEIQHGGKCLQIHTRGKRKTNAKYQLVLRSCSGTSKWSLNKFNKLKSSTGFCINVIRMNEILIEKCRNTKEHNWHRVGAALVHTKTGKCLETLVGSTIGVSNCRPQTYAQLWSFSVEMSENI